MSRLLCLLAMLSTLYGCAALDLISAVTPSNTPSISADLQVGDKSQSAASTGVTAVEENLGTITTVTEGLPPIYLLGMIVIFLLAILGAMYLTFHIGLRTPRPDRYRRARD